VRATLAPEMYSLIEAAGFRIHFRILFFANIRSFTASSIINDTRAWILL
jgi:hypothetical protein